MTDNIGMLDFALGYAERGWKVFPCREKDSELFYDAELKKERQMIAKSPYTKGGLLEATSDSAQITDWWKKFINAAIGIACEPSNLFVIDIDIKDGRKGFENFMALNVEDSGALHATTQGGGMHVIFSGLTNSYANKLTGIDIRSIGTYIIAPPSRIYLPDGTYKSYVALDDWSRTPINVPDGLIEKLELLRYGHKIEKKKRQTPTRIESHSSLVYRAKQALDVLPSQYYENYTLWVNVGLALKELGNDGFYLWDTWSAKSSKYDFDVCKYKWSRFEPREITLASLFYWAKTDGENNER